MDSPEESAALRLEVLGGLRASLGGQPLAGFRTRKAQALLAYLALTGRPQPREVLAGLLWGGVPDSFARTSLRQTLANLRHLLGVYLETTPTTAAVHQAGLWLDAAEFQALLAGSLPGAGAGADANDSAEVDRLRTALTLYGGDFLAGIVVPDAPAFDDWVSVERERLHHLAVGAWRRLALAHEGRGETEDALAGLRGLLALEPWHEEAQSQVMAVLAAAGRRSEALAHYVVYRRRLADELGVQPGAAMVALHERILAGDGAAGRIELGSPSETQRTGQPPAASRPIPAILPVPPTPLLGREAEVDALGRVFERPGVRLVTVVGPPGVGKTHLTLEVATRLSVNFASGACFVDLSALADPALVLPAIAQALGIREDGTQPLPTLLGAALRERHLLLMLDNCEQVLGAAPALAGLLASSARLVVLATSRSPLRLRGEHEFPLEPLSHPDPEQLADLSDPAALARFPAVALFVERAAAVRPEFALTATSARPVAELCARLDGLPLALELAAARTRFLPLEELVARLDGRLPLLAGGPRDLPARQQALRSALDWSYDLLDPTEQQLFRRLSVFAGGFTLEAAGAVCASSARNGGAEVLEGLERLADASLLRRTGTAAGEPRFGMLETLREYALEHLEASGEADEVRQRHAGYLLTLAERGWVELRGPRQTAWTVRLDHEHDNVRAAAGWALAAGSTQAALALRLTSAHAGYWALRGHLAEGRRWLAAALDADAEKTATPASRGRATFWSGWLAWLQGDLGAGSIHLAAAAAALEADDDPWWRGFALSHLSQVLLAQGDLPAARARVEAAVALLRATGDPWGLGIALTQLADVLSEEGDVAAALQLYDEGAALLRRAGDATMLALPLTWSAQAAAAASDHAGARTRYEAALSVARASGHRIFITMALRGLGTLALLDGDHTQAGARFAEALAFGRDLGQLRGADVCLGGLAAVASVRGQPARAARLLGAADAMRGPNVVLDATDRATLEGVAHAARAALGTPAYDRAYAAGRALTPEQAIAFALGTQSSAPPAAAPAV